MKKVVVIGGGTGTYVVLSGLKKYNIDITAIVSTMDSGGSNRVIRDEFGLLPTSDIRQALVALADENKSSLLRQLFTYRFSQGTGIAGMTFGNLFMAAVSDIFHSQEVGISETAKLLGVRGKIVPITLDKTNLVATYENGKKILGEHDIDEPSEKLGEIGITKLEVFPKAQISLEAKKEILAADMIVIGPGDLFTSLLCNLVVGGVAPVIRRSKAKVVYVVNLMTRYGQTTGYSAEKHVEEVNKYLGGNRIDTVIMNNNNKIPKKALDWYKKGKVTIVKDDLKGKSPTIIRTDVLSPILVKRVKSDKLIRSFIRHDAEKLAAVLIKVLPD